MGVRNRHKACVTGAFDIKVAKQGCCTKGIKGNASAMSDARKKQIIDTARALYETKGLAHTSVKDITDECDIARSLFYHYFPNKQAVTSAVLDDYISDYIDSLVMWNAEREEGNIEQALDSVVRVLRLGVFEGSSFRHALDTSENAALYLEFINRVADKTTRYIIDTTVRDYERLHDIHIEYVYETFYTLILGLCGYIRTHRDVSDEVLKSLIAQTLHMDRTGKTGK